MAADNYTTDKVKAKRLKRCSAILFVSSAAQLAIQARILNFTVQSISSHCTGVHL